MFFRIIYFKSTGIGLLFFLTVFMLGIVWGSFNYDGLADALSDQITSIR